MKMKNWKEVKKELLKNKEVALEYEKLKPRYSLISQLIKARIKEGFTQSELASKIGTKQSAIARIESGEINLSLDFLEKMAKALGKRLEIQIK